MIISELWTPKLLLWSHKYWSTSLSHSSHSFSWFSSWGHQTNTTPPHIGNIPGSQGVLISGFSSWHRSRSKSGFSHASCICFPAIPNGFYPLSSCDCGKIKKINGKKPGKWDRCCFPFGVWFIWIIEYIQDDFYWGNNKCFIREWAVHHQRELCLWGFRRRENCLGFQSSQGRFIPVAASLTFHIIPPRDEVTPKLKWDFRRDKMQNPRMCEIWKMLFHNKPFSMDGQDLQSQIQLEWSSSCQCIPWEIWILCSRCLIMEKGRKTSIPVWSQGRNWIWNLRNYCQGTKGWARDKQRLGKILEGY